jgi:hypothetical protein
VTRARGERGFMTVQYVAATGFTLILFALIANVLVDLYARAAVREALDEGVHAAIAIDAPASACETRARDSLHTLTRGPIGRDISVTCQVDAERVHGHADVVLRSWLPAIVPTWRFSLDASARRET